MNINDKFLDDIPYDQAIFTKHLIYRKMKNLKDGYDIHVLTRLDNRFVWDKTNNYENNIDQNITVENFNDLRFATEDVNNDKYLTIYRLYEGMGTDLMIYNSENNLVWSKLNIPMDINNIQTTSLLDIPCHIDLTKECDDENDDNNYNCIMIFKDKIISKGNGKSKKKAEQDSARNGLIHFNVLT